MEDYDSDEELSLASKTLSFMQTAASADRVPAALGAYFLRSCEELGRISTHQLENQSFSGFRLCRACKIPWKVSSGLRACSVRPALTSQRKKRKEDRKNSKSAHKSNDGFEYDQPSVIGCNSVVYACRNCGKSTKIRLKKPERPSSNTFFIDTIPDGSAALPSSSSKSHNLRKEDKKNPQKRTEIASIPGSITDQPQKSSTWKKKDKLTKIRGLLSASATEKSDKKRLSLRDFLS